MNHAKEKREKRIRRHRRVRARISGDSLRPRLSLFRSNKNLSAQIIDDVSRKVLVSAWTKEILQDGVLAKGGAKKLTSRTKSLGKTAKKDVLGSRKNITHAVALGVTIAKKALEKKIKQVVFDRGGYAYHGKVKAFAESARKGGLIF